MPTSMVFIFAFCSPHVKLLTFDPVFAGAAPIVIYSATRGVCR
jgi:hypothetical protein